MKLNTLQGLIPERLNSKCTCSLKFQDDTFTVMKLSLHYIKDKVKLIPTLYLTSVLRQTSGLNCGRVTILAPKYSEEIRMLVRPYTWKKGSTPNTTSCISPAAIKHVPQSMSKVSSGKSSKAVNSNNINVMECLQLSINYLYSTLSGSESSDKTKLFDSLLSYSYIAFIDLFYGLYFRQLPVTNDNCKKSNIFNFLLNSVLLYSCRTSVIISLSY